MDTENLQLSDVVLDSWERHNTIMLNLVRLVPDGGFIHLHHERLISVAEEAPEHAITVPDQEWPHETDRERIAERLAGSGRVVHAATEGRVLAGRALDRATTIPSSCCSCCCGTRRITTARSSSR